MRRPLKILIQLGVLATIAGLVSTVGFVEYSAQPGFCRNCHLMEPYYQSWATSAHSEVKCIECHYAPGIKAEAMGKVAAANQVVKYFTGTYALKPWAEIEDAACLRSGCHTSRKIEGLVDYNGVTFDHTPHLEEQRLGIDLRCTSCHSQIVQGEHVAVTQVTCNLCHFGDDFVTPPVGCVGCHTATEALTTLDGSIVDHPRYVEDMVSCVSCHADVTRGDGSVEESRCFNCHNDTERLEQSSDVDRMHVAHIEERSIECGQCHTPIQHSVVSLASTFELQCGSCHRGVHTSQQQMYAGRGGHDAVDQPSSMFLARVSCEACHELPRAIEGHAEVDVAGEASCMSCHGIRYANILPSWQDEMERRTRQVTNRLEGVRHALPTAPIRTRSLADSLLSLAEENVEFVRVGKSSHNIGYSDELLRSAVTLLTRAVQEGRLDYHLGDLDLGPPVSENSCLECHLGEERRSVSFRGNNFEHDSHVLTAGLACEDCHTPLEEHGGTVFEDLSACNDCHHPVVDPPNCATCHEGAGGAPTAPARTETGFFEHDVHRQADLDCRDCHTPPEMAATELDCQSCHVEHHEPETTCVSCHVNGAMEDHSRNDHVSCSDCHEVEGQTIDRWTRPVCLSCHIEIQDHYEPKACAECHQLPPMSVGGVTVPTTADPDSAGGE